jgi:hypothetical protein
VQGVCHASPEAADEHARGRRWQLLRRLFVLGRRCAGAVQGVCHAAPEAADEHARGLRWQLLRRLFVLGRRCAGAVQGVCHAAPEAADEHARGRRRQLQSQRHHATRYHCHDYYSSNVNVSHVVARNMLICGSPLAQHTQNMLIPGSPLDCDD